MKKITVIYWSGTGNTEMMANAIAKGAKINGNAVKLLSIEDATKEDIISSDAVALGCPAMGSEQLEEDHMETFVASLQDIDLNGKTVALFGSYDWGNGLWMRDWMRKMEKYGANLIDDGLIIHLTPNEEELQECKKLGEMLARVLYIRVLKKVINGC